VTLTRVNPGLTNGFLLLNIAFIAFGDIPSIDIEYGPAQAQPGRD
jgi:hypothetical protein